MNSHTYRRIVAVALVSILGALGPAAHAEVLGDTTDIEVFVGSYDPGPDEFGSEFTWGFRLGWNLSERFGIDSQLGFVSTDGSFTDGTNTLEVDLDVVLLDVSLNIFFMPDSAFNPIIYGGIGGAFTSADVRLVQGANFSLGGFGDDTFTANAGLAARIDLSDTLFIRPDVRLRWFDDRVDDDIDTEYTLSLGWKLGY